MPSNATRLKMRRWSRRHRELNKVRGNTPKYGAPHGPLFTAVRCQECAAIHAKTR